MMEIKWLNLDNVASNIAQQIPDLKMLVLFGSRARGDYHTKSDWDFAVLYDEEKQNLVQEYNQLKIYDSLAKVFQISSDKIDVINLSKCSPLLAFNIAKDGKVVYERTSGEFIYFQMKAWKIYADTQKFRKLQKENIEIWLQKWVM